MAGYKTTIVDDDACSLWTFDGDQFDPTTRKIIVAPGEPEIIIDEIDNLNPAILHSDNATYLGYRMGLASMVEHEQTDQRSISFGWYGNIPLHPSGWPKAYLEVPHTSTYMFPHFGSFSIEMILLKASETAYGCGITRPFIRKAGVFTISLTFNCYGSPSLNITHPGGSTSIDWGSYLGKSLWNRTLHTVLTWGVVDQGGGHYVGTARFYINARIATEQTYNYIDTFPNTNIAVPFEIAGISTSNNINADRHTSNFQLDQIAVYDKALTQDQIANHYAKAFPYEKMVEYDFASNLWPMNDADSLVTFTIAPVVGSSYGQYIGTRNQIVRQQAGPPTVPLSSSCSFQQRGAAMFTATYQTNYYTPFIAINHDYTFEFWFNTTAYNRGVLMSMQSLTPPFTGPLIQINMQDHQFYSGSLQFTETNEDTPLNSSFLDDHGDRYLLNDGQWHHIAVVRYGTQIQLWLDGLLNASNITPVKNIALPGPGQILMMDCMPGRLDCTGNLSEFAIYGFALQPHQIRARVTYATTYKIKGIVTLSGIPYQARIRFYRSSTGELIDQLQSDPDTGEYQVTFYDNSNVDMIVFDPYDLSVRYRAYGPITPSEFEDLPVVL